MLKQRVISGVVGITVLLTAIYLGGLYWQALFLLIGIIGLYEYYQMMNKRGFTVFVFPGILLFLALFFSPSISAYLPALIWLVVVMAIINLLWKYSLSSVNDLAFSLLGAFYIGFLLSFTTRMVSADHAFMLMLTAFVLTWSSDIGSYAFGVTWGKNKMTPHLSPNKTWEGSIGGILLAILAAVIF